MNEDIGALVAERIEGVRTRIAQSCRRCGRDPAAVTLVAVGKRQPIDRIEAALAAGQTVFGENQVQEAEEKAALLDPAIEWHMIGPLQSNKSRRAAGLFTVIHSVDRQKIALRLERDLERLGRTVRAFAQVHLGAEETKHGFAESELRETLRPLADLEHLRIEGLMAIPPWEEDPERARAWFRRLREHRDALAETPEWRDWAGALSMGMSHDFEVAIEEGATHVRVGTALFGDRPD